MGAAVVAHEDDGAVLLMQCVGCSSSGDFCLDRELGTGSGELLDTRDGECEEDDVVISDAAVATAAAAAAVVSAFGDEDDGRKGEVDEEAVGEERGDRHELVTRVAAGTDDPDDDDDDGAALPVLLPVTTEAGDAAAAEAGTGERDDDDEEFDATVPVSEDEAGETAVLVREEGEFGEEEWTPSDCCCCWGLGTRRTLAAGAVSLTMVIPREVTDE